MALVGFGAWSLLSSRTGPTATASVTTPAATTLTTPEAKASPAILTAAPVATPPATRLDQLLVQHGNDTTTEAALGKLFALWHLEYRVNGGKGCDQAGSQGLECLFQKGSWAQLRTLNRPAVLTLNGPRWTRRQHRFDGDHETIRQHVMRKPVLVVRHVRRFVNRPPDTMTAQFSYD